MAHCALDLVSCHIIMRDTDINNGVNYINSSNTCRSHVGIGIALSKSHAVDAHEDHQMNLSFWVGSLWRPRPIILSSLNYLLLIYLSFIFYE